MRSIATRNTPPAAASHAATDGDAATSGSAWVALSLIVVVAALVRLLQLDHQSLWIDEIIANLTHQEGSFLDAALVGSGPLEPPLSHVLSYLAQKLPLPIEMSARLPAAVFGALEAAPLFLLMRQATSDIRVALVAASLAAVAPFAVRYAQDARYYTLSSVFHLAGWWLLLRAMRRSSTAHWSMLGVAWALALLSHPFAWVTTVAQFAVAVVWHVRHRGRRRKKPPPQLRGIVSATLIATVLAVPWYVASVFGFLSETANESIAIGTPERFSVSLNLDLLWRGGSLLLSNPFQIYLLAGGVGVVIVLSPVLASGWSRRLAIAIGAYLLAFTALIATAARPMGTYFAYRRIEFFVPVLMGAAAIGIVAAYDRSRRAGLPRGTALVVPSTVLVAALALSSWSLMTHYASEKTNYRGAAEILAQVPPDTTVIMGPFDPIWYEHIESYLRQAGTGIDLMTLDEVDTRRGPGRVYWLTGNPPTLDDFSVEPLNAENRLQAIAGDATWPDVRIPLYLSHSQPDDENELAQQLEHVRGLRWVLATSKDAVSLTD